MKRDEIERRIALLKALKQSFGEDEIPKRDLDAVLPIESGSMDRKIVPARSTKRQRGGVVGVWVVRKGGATFYRASIQTPTGKRLYSVLFAEWWRAVRQRNRWAAKYYPDQPEFECDFQAAMDKWGKS